MRILKTPSEVKRCLERSGDWYQPATTTSFLRIGSHHRTFSQEEPFGPGFIDAVAESNASTRETGKSLSSGMSSACPRARWLVGSASHGDTASGDGTPLSRKW